MDRVSRRGDTENKQGGATGWESEAVKLSYDNGVAFITIDRPPVNALNLEVLSELSEVLRELRKTC